MELATTVTLLLLAWINVVQSMLSELDQEEINEIKADLRVYGNVLGRVLYSVVDARSEFQENRIFNLGGYDRIVFIVKAAESHALSYIQGIDVINNGGAEAKNLRDLPTGSGGLKISQPCRIESYFGSYDYSIEFALRQQIHEEDQILVSVYGLDDLPAEPDEPSSVGENSYDEYGGRDEAQSYPGYFGGDSGRTYGVQSYPGHYQGYY